MIAIILCIIAAIVLTILAQKDAKKHNGEFGALESGLVIFCTALIVIAIDLTAWGIYSCTAIEITEASEVVASTNLVTLQDNSSVTGSFFLGSGSLNNKTHYAFYYETDHGYKYKTIDAESSSNPVYIKYISADEAPRIDQYSVVERETITANGSRSWLVSIIAWFSYRQYAPGDLISEETTGPAMFASSGNPNYYDSWRYEIYIPEGSVQQNYTIDLQ